MSAIHRCRYEDVPQTGGKPPRVGGDGSPDPSQELRPVAKAAISVGRTIRPSIILRELPRGSCAVRCREQRRQALKRRAAGESLTDIALTFTVVSRSTIMR